MLLKDRIVTNIRNTLKVVFFLGLKQIACPLYFLNSLLFREVKVPVLAYHKITSIKEGLDAFWNVTPEQFAYHMKFLSENGFEVVPLEHLCRYLNLGLPLPRSWAAITFDDGYGSFYRHAFPILKRYNFPATLFLTGSYAGNGKIYWWDIPLVRNKPEVYEECRTLFWSELREMSASGYVSVGSHTMSHPHLARLAVDRIRYELEASKNLLEAKLGKPVLFFAYPGGIRRYGDLSDETRTLLIEYGYKAACTSEMGRNGSRTDPFLIKRVGMGCKDDIALFRAKLSGSFDWMGTATQLFQKAFNSAF